MEEREVEMMDSRMEHRRQEVWRMGK